MWLDDCIIPFVDEPDPSAKRYQSYRNVDNLYGGYGDTHNDYKEQQGRFTPNLLVCDDMLNDGSNTQYGKKVNYNNSTFKEGLYGFECKAEAPFMYGDKGTNSRYYDLDKWFDKIIDSL